MSDRPAPREAPEAAELRRWAGHVLDDVAGVTVGRIEGAFGEASGSAWLLARMGRFGHHTLVPARDAVEGVERVWVPYPRERIRAAPRIEPGGELAADAERAYVEHYGIVAREGDEMGD